jgi:TetR/AcrR family transcriptional regulator, mexJK operon transcriptional repressor
MMENEKRPRHRPVDLAKRAAILDAARDEFFLKGFEAASIEAIAANADVSKVTVYNHFKNKKGLLSATVQRECEAMSQNMDLSIEEKDDFRQTLIAFAEAKMAFLTQPHIIRFEHMIAREAEKHPEIGTLFLEAGPLLMHQASAAFFDHAIAKGVMKPCDSHAAAGHFYGLITGFDIISARFSIHKGPWKSDRARIEQTVDLFLRLYAV